MMYSLVGLYDDFGETRYVNQIHVPCAHAIGNAMAPAIRKPHEPLAKQTAMWVSQAAEIQSAINPGTKLIIV
tara:strand:- start:295 stop:510 length:216 start_codon:yes stop_codon:yes gene_type:complete